MLKREGNVFLTGAAGTGKSFLLERYLSGKHPDEFPVVASTGAAAVLIGGRTFHSFFGLGILEGGIEATVTRALRSRKLMNRLNRACCVVIDEVSMLSGAMLEAAEVITRRARGRHEPWGGLRVIVVGDFAQLPPVTPGNQMKDWAFLHQVWEESAFQPALLSTVMRTQDVDFLQILNAVRAGHVTDDVQMFLDAHTQDVADDAEGTRLYAHRVKADQHNMRRLEDIPRREHTFQTQYAGDARAVESAKRSIPIPDVLCLKEGALIMMRKNDISGEQLYVNGSLGHVREITEDTLSISLMSGEDIEVEKTKFTSLDGDGQEVAAAWNFPVTLAWATTIHKAQGASLDRMVVDLSALWEPGQAYVALSRVRSAAGLTVERWSPHSIRAEQLVTDFYNSLVDAADSYVPRPLFVPPERVRPKETDEEGHAKPSAKKQDRTSAIRTMLRDEATLDEMVMACGIKSDRVLLYIEEMIEHGETLSIRHLISDIVEADAIREAFETNGLGRLKPAFDALDGGVSYTDIRLVRCVMMAEQAAAA